MKQTLEHLTDCEDNAQVCAGCDEHNCYIPNWSSQTEKAYCDGCRESDQEHLSTIVYLSNANNAPVKFYLGDYFSFTEWGDDLPSNITREYVQTDGWRGYYQTTIQGTVEVDAGADLWGERTDVRDLAERLKDAQTEGTLPCAVYVAVEPTSNLFATALTILVNENDVDIFKEWSNN